MTMGRNDKAAILAALPVKLTPAEVSTLDAASAPDVGYPYDFIGAREPW